MGIGVPMIGGGGGGDFTVVPYTAPSTWPYTIAAADYVVLIDTSVARTTILPSAVTNPGRVLIIKDNVGSAATNNVTVASAAGNVDGAASYTMNINWQSITVVSNGTNWRVV